MSLSLEPKTVAIEPVLQELFDWWDRTSAGRPYPTRAELRMDDIPSVVPWLFIVEIISDPADYRFRLSGSRLDEQFGFCLTGRHLSTLPIEAGHLASIWAQYDETLEGLRPTVCAHAHGMGYSRDIVYHRLVLPASTTGAHPDLLIGAFVFEHSWPLLRSAP